MLVNAVFRNLKSLCDFSYGVTVVGVHIEDMRLPCIFLHEWFGEKRE